MCSLNFIYFYVIKCITRILYLFLRILKHFIYFYIMFIEIKLRYICKSKNKENDVNK